MVYLRSKTTEDGKREVEIKRRIEIARNAFNNNTRMRLIKCHVWLTLLKDTETWTIAETLTKRIDAFEMWTCR